MKDKFLKQANREFSLEKRLALMPFLAIIFLGILPGGLVYLSQLLDSLFKLPPWRSGSLM